MENTKEIRIFLDGDKWCAVRGDFINLQESIAGFGETPTIAFERMRLKELNNK